jgi:hypothetical protein
VFWGGIILITVAYSVITVLYFDYGSVGSDIFITVGFSINFVVDVLGSTLITIAVVKFSKMTTKLPHHLKVDKKMMLSHLILFNLFSAFELALVIMSWLRLNEEWARHHMFSTWLVTGFLVQLLIAAVIVKFSKPTENAKTKEVWD